MTIKKRKDENMKYEVITELTDKDVFNIAHKFTTLKGSEFNPIEIDFLFSFVTQIEEDDEVFKEYQIDKNTLENKMQRRIENKRISTLFKNLIGKYIEAEDNNKIKTFSIFDTLEYDKVNKVYSIRFSSQMKPFLLKLKPFTKGYLSDIFKIESAYSKKIYLLCSQWRKAGSFKIKVEKLMDELQVSKSLRRYDNFKRKVLKVAEKNMLNKTSIYFEYKELKKGRKVDELLFIIKQNPNIAKEKDQPKLFKDPTFEEQIEALKGQKIYIEGKLFLFAGLEKDKYYTIKALTPDKQKLAKVKTTDDTEEMILGRIKGMMTEYT